MLLLLLSLIVLIAQGFLGMADWWVLISNWLVSGAICLSMTAVLNNQSLVSYSHISVSIKAWVLLASMMNLSAIYIAPELSQFRLSATVAGYAILLMVGFFCWQKKSMPVRSLSLGVAIGLLTLLYIPSLIWIVIALLFLFHCMCWSKDNLACVLTGLATMVWINYCVLELCGSDERVDNYIFSFVTAWNGLSYGFPTLIGEGYTGLVFLFTMVLMLIVYTLMTLFSPQLSSLRLRSNMALQCSVAVLLLALLPTCWQLYIPLVGITLCVHVLFSMGNEPSRHITRSVNSALYFFLFMGVGEYLIRLTIDYVSTLSFSLPFEIPFL